MKPLVYCFGKESNLIRFFLALAVLSCIISILSITIASSVETTLDAFSSGKFHKSGQEEMNRMKYYFGRKYGLFEKVGPSVNRVQMLRMIQKRLKWTWKIGISFGIISFFFTILLLRERGVRKLYDFENVDKE